QGTRERALFPTMGKSGTWRFTSRRRRSRSSRRSESDLHRTQVLGRHLLLQQAHGIRRGLAELPQQALFLGDDREVSGREVGDLAQRRRRLAGEEPAIGLRALHRRPESDTYT